MAYTSWSVVFGEQPSAAKWNILGTNDASFNDGTGIGAGVITPEKLLASTGVSWVWQSWAPTFTNLSGGTLNYAKYTQVGKTVTAKLKYTLAGAGISGAVTFSLPVTASADYTSTVEFFQASTALSDTGTALYMGEILWATSTTAQVRARTSSATVVALSSTFPHTWANTDFIQTTFTYEAA